MAAASASFEVQIYKVDHWVLDTRFDIEAEALSYARRILSGGKIEGVRVVRDWRRPDGRHVETEIHAEFRAVSRTVAVAPLDEAPPVCTTVGDVYGVQSRMAINRLLRNYVERAVVTPTEVLHNHAELTRLLGIDGLVTGAVGRVAVLQAEQGAGDGRSRREALNGLLESVRDRAQRAATRKDLPAITATGFRPMFDQLNSRLSAEERDFLARVVLSRELVQMRNWLAKLDFLGELVREDGGLADEPLTVVDGVIADVMGAPSVAQELLGMQGSLAEALCNLIDLARGRLAPGGRAEDDRAVHLNELLAFHDLDETRLVILDLVRRQLKGTQPLYRHDPGKEREAFQAVLERVLSLDGIVGGGPMAEALVLRCLRFHEAGGATGRRQAIAEVAAGIPGANDRVRFLIALAGTELGRQHADDIGAALTALTGDPADFDRFIDRRLPVKDNLETLTLLYCQIAEAPLPEERRRRFADNLDHMLVAYIIHSRVVEHLDNPGDPLRHRANRLIGLCAPGTLRSRRALDMVRRRVVDHLRQPNFEHKYVEDLPDRTQRQLALREFYRLLGEAGFT
ncbi:hypothetical protein [Azospirillum rugosum]|uniref:Uncharacterized protein n=1 Tax=Azospirillum rugosum TaxID=416170 RepID=A0ABS4SHD9_9PROT|nr:hypothetical protein [Azospirillum rugosum]MBP2291981.1 hypothetical protein [Azospirillum rugosum]MDQ0525883.1 hypothetical protein [Azospirillum rugosum]